MPTPSRRLLWLATAAVAVACGLNPQPSLPDNDGSSDGAAGSGTGGSGGTSANGGSGPNIDVGGKTNVDNPAGGAGEVVQAEGGADGRTAGGESSGGEPSSGGQGGDATAGASDVLAVP